MLPCQHWWLMFLASRDKANIAFSITTVAQIHPYGFVAHMSTWNQSLSPVLWLPTQCHCSKTMVWKLQICYIMPGLSQPCPLETEQWHIAPADCTRGSESLNRPHTLSALNWPSLSGHRTTSSISFLFFILPNLQILCAHDFNCYPLIRCVF